MFVITHMKETTKVVVIRREKRPILMAVTRNPHDLRMRPMLLAVLVLTYSRRLFGGTEN